MTLLAGHPGLPGAHAAPPVEDVECRQGRELVKIHSFVGKCLNDSC